MSRDFYFSAKSFNLFQLGVGNESEVVGECLIDGEWLPFTEVTSNGMNPLSTAWGDLIYLGEANQTRYTNAVKWIEQNTY